MSSCESVCWRLRCVVGRGVPGSNYAELTTQQRAQLNWCCGGQDKVVRGCAWYVEQSAGRELSAKACSGDGDDGAGECNNRELVVGKRVVPRSGERSEV